MIAKAYSHGIQEMSFKKKTDNEILSLLNLKTQWEKRRICPKRAISPSIVSVCTRLKNFLPFSSKLELLSANYFSLEDS